jgi:hypothetical protein
VKQFLKIGDERLRVRDGVDDDSSVVPLVVEPTIAVWR